MPTLNKRTMTLLFISMLMLTMTVITGCGSSSNRNEAANIATSDNSMSTDSALGVQSGTANKVSNQVEMAKQADIGSGMTAIEGSTDGHASSFHRKLIYRANITMEVDDYAKEQSKIRDMIALSDGYILEFSDHKTLYEQTGNFVIRVPAQGFFSFIDQLRLIQPKLQQSIKGQDFTEEYVDLSSRLKSKRLVEERLSTFMEQATRADDLLQYSNQLAIVQEEIETIEGRMRYIDQNVSYSTIELRVYQRLGKTADQTHDHTFVNQVVDAMKSSSEFVYRLLQGLVIVIAALLPVMVVLAFISIPILYLYFRRRKASAALRNIRRSEAHAKPNEETENRNDP